MVANVSINPILQTSAAGSFNVTSDGYVQGQALDQPAIRYSLAGGTLSISETVPMWGGIAIKELVGGAAGGPNSALGSIIQRATVETDITGFSVFDQNHAMIQSPESPVPLSGSYMQVNFYRLKSGARIAVACSPSLVDLEGNIITTAVAWDYVNQQLEPYVTATVSSGTYPAGDTISSGTYTPATGLVSLVIDANHGLLPGDTFSISGLTGTGTFAALNGTWVATTGSATTVLNFIGPLNMPAATITGGTLLNVGVTMTTSGAHGLVPGDTFVISSPVGTGFSLIPASQTASVGTTGTTLNFVTAADINGGSVTITSATIGNGTAIPVSVLDVNIGNSMVVEYNATTGLATWNRQGNCAVILL